MVMVWMTWDDLPLAALMIVGFRGMFELLSISLLGRTISEEAPMRRSSKWEFSGCFDACTSDWSTELKRALRVVKYEAKQAMMTAMAAAATVAAMTRVRNVTTFEGRNPLRAQFESIAACCPLRACDAGSRCKRRASSCRSRSCSPTRDQVSDPA